MEHLWDEFLQPRSSPLWQEARAGAGMCRGRLWMRWYLPEDDALGVCESDPPRCREPAWLCHRDAWTSFRLCISPALPLTSQGVFLENIQHWVLLLPVHLGSPGSHRDVSGCEGWRARSWWVTLSSEPR